MWKENSSCSNWSCSTWWCHKTMFPIMIIVALLIGWWIWFYQKNNITEAENMLGEIKPNMEKSKLMINDAEEKFKAVENEIHMMKNNWMNNVSKLYTDLTFVKSVEKWSDEIIAWMWDEDWLYSPTYNTTVIVCKSLNTPAYAFKWREISKEEITKIRGMNKQMMKEMDAWMMWSWETMMWWQQNMEMWSEMKKDEIMMKSWVYKDYSPEAIKNAQWKIVLFFHADWCPSCKATDKDILSKNVPENITILKVNFDKEIDLKQKYWVLAQTTFVQIDKNWNEITKWVWWDLEDIISSIK